MNITTSKWEENLKALNAERRAMLPGQVMLAQYERAKRIELARASAPVIHVTVRRG